jgi:hypothetical protein
VSDLAFGVLLVTAGAALVVYRAALGDRARARGARFGGELYVVAGVFLIVFGLWEVLGSLR